MTQSEAGAVRRVLVADDDPSIRTLLTLTLETEGLEVATVSDGAAVRPEIERARPDLIILDIMMPEQDGLSVLRELRADPRTRTIPVVLLTAKATGEDAWEGWEAGADHYVTKPFDIEDLLHYIASVSLDER